MSGWSLMIACMGFVLWAAPQHQSDLPAWTDAPPEPDLFVVVTEDFSTHYEATTKLLPAVKAEVTNWAIRELGPDSRPIIDSIPADDFEALIYQKQEIIHKFGIDYDPETARRLEADHDDFYRGYIRVHIDDDFRDSVEQKLGTERVRYRLCETLIAAMFFLGLLGIAWSYFFTNHLSRGFYISRLRWIAGGLVVALLLVCYATSLLIF